MRKSLFILFFCLVAAGFPGAAAVQRITLSFDEAIRVIQRGIGAPGVSEQEAWEASFTVLETAKRNPELVKPFKDLLIKEITRLDAWDHYTETSADYMRNLVRALWPLADPDLVPLFILQCQYGSYVREGLAKVGRPAIPPVIDELLHGRYHTCAAMSLAAIAREGLGSASQLSPGKMELLRRDLEKLAVPALERFLELARQEERAGLGLRVGSAEWRRVISMEGLTESLEEIRQLLSGSRPPKT